MNKLILELGSCNLMLERVEVWMSRRAIFCFHWLKSVKSKKYCHLQLDISLYEIIN